MEQRRVRHVSSVGIPCRFSTARACLIAASISFDDDKEDLIVVAVDDDEGGSGGDEVLDSGLSDDEDVGADAVTAFLFVVVVVVDANVDEEGVDVRGLEDFDVAAAMVEVDGRCCPDVLLC